MSGGADLSILQVGPTAETGEGGREGGREGRSMSGGEVDFSILQIGQTAETGT